MKIIVTTPLHIFLVDINTNEYFLLRTGDGYYYGISFWENNIVLSHSFGCISILNSNSLKYSQKHLLQPHQIEWINDQIIVTNTGKNRLTIYNPQGKFIKDVFLNNITWDDKNINRLGNHFNTVHLHENNLYVVAHNYDRQSEIYIISYPSFKVETILQTKANWAHNIWIGEYGTIICNSKKGTLEEATNGHILWQADTPGIITRGLAVTKDYLIIGGSIYSERRERYWTDGKIWIIDRKDQRILNEIVLLGSGEVNEIRVIGNIDECHNNQILEEENLLSLQHSSYLISLAYKLRKKYSFLRKDLFPLSQVVRVTQILTRVVSYHQKKRVLSHNDERELRHSKGRSRPIY